MDRTSRQASFRRSLVLGVAGLFVAAGSHAGSYDDFFIDVKRDYAGGVQALLQRGFDPDSRDPSGQPALVLAVQQGSRRVLEVLLAAAKIDLDAMNPVGESALMLASLRGDLDLAAKLIARGARIDHTGWTPLHYAVTGTTSGNRQIAVLLLERGAAVDARSPNGTTPLMMAARYGSEQSVELLLQRGADPRLHNERGMDAADFARGAGRDGLVKLLTAPR